MDKFDKDIEEFNYIMRLLLATDQFFNVLLWNGSHNETISGNIGRQIKRGDANVASKCVCWGLRKLQSRHCIKSIGE